MQDDEDIGRVPPHVNRAVGPRMAELVGRTPLDQEAADQIDLILNGSVAADLVRPMVAVALLNCTTRRIADAEAEIVELKALTTEIEAAAKTQGP